MKVTHETGMIIAEETILEDGYSQTNRLIHFRNDVSDPIMILQVTTECSMEGPCVNTMLLDPDDPKLPKDYYEDETEKDEFLLTPWITKAILALG